MWAMPYSWNQRDYTRGTQELLQIQKLRLYKMPYFSAKTKIICNDDSYEKNGWIGCEEKDITWWGQFFYLSRQWEICNHCGCEKLMKYSFDNWGLVFYYWSHFLFSANLLLPDINLLFLCSKWIISEFNK